MQEVHDGETRRRDTVVEHLHLVLIEIGDRVGCTLDHQLAFTKRECREERDQRTVGDYEAPAADEPQSHRTDHVANLACTVRW